MQTNHKIAKIALINSEIDIVLTALDTLKDSSDDQGYERTRDICKNIMIKVEKSVEKNGNR